MLNQFSRTELLIGSEGLKKLFESKVVVFGIGGVGGYVVEALARSGVGAIGLVDNDKFSLTNLNRQIYATRNSIEQYKVDVAEERIKDINPNCKVEKFKTFFSSENSEQFNFGKYNYIVDAIDTVSSKVELVVKANEKGVPIISSMGTGNKMHPEMFEIADIYKTSVCPLAKIMRQELKKRGIKHLKVVYSKETPIRPVLKLSEESGCNKVIGSNAFTPAVAGLIIASEVINEILNDCNS